MLDAFHIIEFDEISSTQSYAKELFVAGKLLVGDVIVAKSQTIGHGRYGRNWQSPKGNIYMTMALKPHLEPTEWAQLSYVIAVSISEAILFIDNCIDIQHKWVNDLLINGQKFAGILLDNMQDRMLLIGVGINIVYNEDLKAINATALSKHSSQMEYQLVLKTILERIKVNYDTYCNFGFVPIKNLWLKRAYRLNEEILVRFRDTEQRGTFLGIDDAGRLQLFNKNKIELVSAGEVFFG